jgi:hypothetical protein
MVLDPRPAVSAASILLAAACSPTRPAVAIIFDLSRTDLPASVTARLEGPLTAADVARIESIASDELRAAYAPFHVEISDDPTAFWRVRVVHDMTPQAHATASVGESVALGPLGGAGFVDLVAIAFEATRFAPAAASRSDIVDGIGRGVGRAAAHEIGHQILGPTGAHNDLDGLAYENGSPSRQAQYYGQLRWTTWRSRIGQRLGER